MKYSLLNESIKPLVLALAATLAAPASAQVLLEDSFDFYSNQTEFETAWQVVPTPNVSGTLDTVLSLSLPNSIRFATTAQRNQSFFSETGTPFGDITIVRFSLDYYDTNAGVNPYRQFHNLQDGISPTSSGQLIGLGLNNNQLSTDNGGNYYMGRILGYTPNETGATGSGAFFKLNGPGAPLRSTGWHNLAVEVSDTEFRFYVDNILSETVPNTFTLRSYDVVRIGSGLSSTQTGNVDNVKVEIIPEPAGISLLALGAAGFAARRRRAAR